MGFTAYFHSLKNSTKLEDYRKTGNSSVKPEVWAVDPATCMTKQEAEQFLKGAEERKKQGTKAAIKDWIFVVIGLNTGLRRSEIINLDCRHLQLYSPENAGVFVKGGKTAHSRRWIPLSPATVEVILEYKDSKLRWGESWDDNEPFLRTPTKTKLRYDESSLNIAFKRVLKHAKNIERPDRFHPHSMRHTYATRVYEDSGSDIKMVSELLGHSSVEITARAYIHVFSNAKRKAVEHLYDNQKRDAVRSLYML